MRFNIADGTADATCDDVALLPLLIGVGNAGVGNTGVGSTGVGNGGGWKHAVKFPSKH